MTEDVTSPTLAERINRVFGSMRHRDARTGDLREYSLREVSEAITAAGVPTSYSFIGQLRTGKKDNIDLKRLRALAKFFGVPVEYFTSDHLVDAVNYELDLASTLQELKARQVALRESVLAQAEQATQSLANVVEYIRDLERSNDDG